jgi:putative transposase
MIKTYRFRVKNYLGELNRQSKAVNFIWNYCNDIQKKAVSQGRRWLTVFDLNALTSGSSVELNLYAHTVQEVCRTYVNSRTKAHKRSLRYRSNKKSLGWIPLSNQAIKIIDNTLVFRKLKYKVFGDLQIPEGSKILYGSSFSQDSKRNWYLNLVLEIPDQHLLKTNKSVGIDLGLKHFATLSDGTKVEAQKEYRKLEGALAGAQRAHKKQQVRNISRKIANRRKDFNHKLSTQIVESYDNIAVGNVSSSRLIQTKMAKSVTDAGWSSFRNMLKYKSDYAGRGFMEVNENFSTQDCSTCGSRNGPKGLEALEIRRWVCNSCNTSHDRDINAAMNILARSGYGTPVEGVIL